MNNLIKITIVLSLTFLVCFLAQAQDKIYKKNKEVIECTIKEVGSEDIKYHTSDVPEDVLLSISIDKIVRIEFSNGKKMIFQDNFSDPENYADQRKNAIKINFLEPLNGSTSFTLERSLKPGRSIEGSIGIIGLGWDSNNYNGAGAYVGFGIKFLSKPDYYLRKMRYAHILKGFYVKPEVLISSYKVLPFEYGYYGLPGSPVTSSEDKVSVTTAVFLINVGKQWVFDDAFLLELFGGVGYGVKSRDDVKQYSIFVGDEVPLAGRVGFRIGFLL